MFLTTLSMIQIIIKMLATYTYSTKLTGYNFKEVLIALSVSLNNDKYFMFAVAQSHSISF